MTRSRASCTAELQTRACRHTLSRAHAHTDAPSTGVPAALWNRFGTPSAPASIRKKCNRNLNVPTNKHPLDYNQTKMFSCVAHAQHACCFLSTPNRDTLSALNIEPLSLDSPNSWCMSKTSLQIDPWPHRLDQLHQFHQPHGSTFTKVYLILFILNPIWPVPRTCNDTSTITNQPPRAFLAVWPCIIELFN